MAEPNQALVLDRAQVKKAVLALQAFLNSKTTSEALFLNQSEPVSLLFTLWKIPKKPQSFRIPLPHNQRTESDEVCLFTRDEPSMTSDQTQRFYKRLLQEQGINNITEVIPYKVLKTEYKSIESKRRLIGNFDLFLSDDRIQRLLPSHLGKNFYRNKKDPLPVNLQSKNLSRDLKSVIHGMRMKINNKGPCCMASVGHSGMTTEDLIENVESAVKAVTEKMRTKGPVMKLIHLKSLASVALPIYSADLSHLAILEEAQKLEKPLKRKRPAKKASAESDGNDEEIPQLVPIETPVKKAKLEKPPKNEKKPVLETAPKAAGQKRSPRARRKRPHKLASQNKPPRPASQKKDPRPASQKKDPRPASQKKDPRPASQKKDPRPASQKKDPRPASQKKDPRPASQKKDQKQPTQTPGKASSQPRRKGRKAK